jgi:hypothetical protein
MTLFCYNFRYPDRISDFSHFFQSNSRYQCSWISAVHLLVRYKHIRISKKKKFKLLVNYVGCQFSFRGGNKSPKGNIPFFLKANILAQFFF